MVDFESKNDRYGCQWLRPPPRLTRFEVEASFELACTQDPDDAYEDYSTDYNHFWDMCCDCSENVHHDRYHTFRIGVYLSAYSDEAIRAAIEKQVMELFDFNLYFHSVGWIKGDYPWPCTACKHDVVVRSMTIRWYTPMPWNKHPREFVHFAKGR